MTLESRAANAAQSLRSSLATVGPGYGFPTLLRKRRLAAVGGLAFMTLLLFGAVALASVLPVFDEEQAADSTIHATTTIPTEPTTPAVVPDEKGEDEEKSTTTTTKPSSVTTIPGAGDPTLDPEDPGALVAPGDGLTPPTSKAETTTTTKAETTTTTKVETTTTTTKPPGYGYTASQQSGGSGEGLNDVYWGTGPAGYVVKIYVPDYGRIVGQTTISANGQWEVAVSYGDVAANTNFHVKVDFYSGGSHVKRLYHSYTWLNGDTKPYAAYLQSGGSGTELADVAYGTGPAGYTVKVWIYPYNRTLAEVTIDANGNWEAAINYGEVTPNQKFEVKSDFYNGGTKVKRIYNHYTWIQETGGKAYTANQASGGEGDGLTDAFWGTGPAGYTVKIWLPDWNRYVGQTTIDANGDWEVGVNYGDVPANQNFHVKADLYNGGTHIERKYFAYTWIQDGGHTFSASQTYGSCSESPPYEVLYGTGAPGTDVLLWSEYGSTQVTVDANGEWSGTLTLNGASNGTHQIKAKDHLGTKIWFDFTVSGQGEQHEFTATQTFATSNDDPPGSTYYGTGTPGTTVQILSAYGSGSVVVNQAGQWTIAVTFPDAPIGEGFVVKAKDASTGEYHSFEFTRTG